MTEACAVGAAVVDDASMRRAIAEWADANRVVMDPEAELELLDVVADLMRASYCDEPSEAIADAEAWQLITLDPVRNGDGDGLRVAPCFQCERLVPTGRLHPGPDGYQVCLDCICRILRLDASWEE